MSTMRNKLTTVHEHVNNFDLIRLLAAFAVLVSHSWPLSLGEHDPAAFGFTLGGAAVCVFFFISGYLVTGSWERNSNIASFVEARARRIYPALIVNVAACTFILGLALTSLSAKDYLWAPETWRYLVTASAIKLQASLPGVFANNPLPAVNGSLWTLPYEIACYVALLVALQATKKKPMLVVLFAIAGLCFHAIFLNLQIDSLREATAKHIHYLTRFGVAFCLGVIARKIEIKQNRWKGPLATGAILCALMISLADTGALQVYAGIFFICFVTAIVALHAPVTIGLPKSMGDISYGVYIYAFPVQQTLKNYGIASDSIWLYILLSALITAVLAAFSWNLVEKPFLKRKIATITSDRLSDPHPTGVPTS